MRRTRFALALSLLLAPALGAQDSADWPRWRGPLGTGEAPSANPPVEWSETKNVAWKTALPGHGKSTPIVHGERIFVLCALPTREATKEELAARAELDDQFTEAPDELVAFLALAVDRKTGDVLWETQLAERLPIAGNHETNGYASFSPVTDGEALFASLGSYGVYALDAEDGEVRWTYDLGPQRSRRGWGEAGSPALAGDTLLIVADQEDQSRIHALDKSTGEVRWKRDRDEPSTWTTPLVVETGDLVQAVVNGSTAVRSYDVGTGDVLWHCDGQTANAIPSPVTDGELVVCTSGFKGSACYAFDLGGRGDLREAQDSIAWNRSKGTPYIPSPLLVDGRVYLLSGFTSRISCLDLATGEVLIDRRPLEIGNVYSSPVAAAGRLYLVGREGTTVVLDLADDLKELARNELDEPIDASPAPVGAVLFLRSESSLYAIGTP